MLDFTQDLNPNQVFGEKTFLAQVFIIFVMISDLRVDSDSASEQVGCLAFLSRSVLSLNFARFGS